MFMWKDPKHKDGSCCPRPLSRKKLRQLMRHNHENLTASAMSARFGRQTKAQIRANRLREREKLMEAAGVAPESDGDTGAVVKGGVFGRMLAYMAGIELQRQQRKAAKGK
jgi:hypothetical protein